MDRVFPRPYTYQDHVVLRCAAAIRRGRTHTRVYIYINVCVRERESVCVCVCIHSYIHTHINAYTHKQVRSSNNEEAFLRVTHAENGSAPWKFSARERDRLDRELDRIKQLCMGSPMAHAAPVRECGGDDFCSWAVVARVDGPTLRERLDTTGPLSGMPRVVGLF